MISDTNKYQVYFGLEGETPHEAILLINSRFGGSGAGYNEEIKEAEINFLTKVLTSNKKTDCENLSQIRSYTAKYDNTSIKVVDDNVQKEILNQIFDNKITDIKNFYGEKFLLRLPEMAVERKDKAIPKQKFWQKNLARTWLIIDLSKEPSEWIFGDFGVSYCGYELKKILAYCHYYFEFLEDGKIDVAIREFFDELDYIFRDFIIENGVVLSSAKKVLSEYTDISKIKGLYNV